MTRTGWVLSFSARPEVECRAGLLRAAIAAWWKSLEAGRRGRVTPRFEAREKADEADEDAVPHGGVVADTGCHDPDGAGSTVRVRLAEWASVTTGSLESETARVDGVLGLWIETELSTA